MNLIQEFQKRAAAAGLTPEQTQAFINSNGLAEKLAEPSPETIFSQLCDAANVEKSAEAYAYAEGVLTQASQRGLTAEQALHVTKQALASTFPPVAAPVQKQASEEDITKQAYFEGLFEKAASLGFSREQTIAFLQKAASGLPGGGALAGAGAVASSLGGLAGKAGRGLSQGFSELASKAKGLMPSGKSMGAVGLGGLLGAGGHAALHTDPGIGEQLLSLIQQNPELAGALGGAGLGGIAGGLSGLPGEADPNNPEAGKSHVGRNALLGALAGGGIGAGAGHFAPDMFKRLAGGSTPQVPHAPYGVAY